MIGWESDPNNGTLPLRKPILFPKRRNMESSTHCLLTEPLIPVRIDSGSNRFFTLPETLSALARGEAIQFPMARAHQFYPWYAFLVQLSAMAMHASQKKKPPHDKIEWKESLLDLAEGQFEAFSLMVSDLSKPAFLQPPVPEKSTDVLKNHVDYPDQMDVLVTAKNHDLKAARICRPHPAHWMYSLVVLQTTQGVLGRDNYGIVRMNGGFASRPFAGFTPSLEWSNRYIRDLTVLMDYRDKLVEAYEYPENGGKRLLWLYPWNGTTSFKLTDCDPYFIEICRRIRLVRDGGQLIALAGNSKRPRIYEPDRKGNTGDPWTPVDRTGEGKALNVGNSGFHYTLMHRMLFQGDFQPGACQILRPTDEKQLLFSGYALARKQGGTQGIYERLIPIPPKVVRLLGSLTERDVLGKRAQIRIEMVRTWTANILRPALCALLQGGAAAGNMKDMRTRKWERSLDQAVDDIFFEELWKDLEVDPEEASRNWLNLLYRLAGDQLERAMKECPVHSGRYFRAIAAAERVFHGRAMLNYPELFERKGE